MLFLSLFLTQPGRGRKLKDSVKESTNSFKDLKIEDVIEMKMRKEGESEEVTVFVVPEGNNVKILTDAQMEWVRKQKEKQEYRERGLKGERFVQATKYFQDDFIYELNAKEKERIMRTFPFIQYTKSKKKKEENEEEKQTKSVIRFGSKPALSEEFQKIWGTLRDTTDRTLKKFVKKGIFKEVFVDGELYGYQFNEEVVFRGPNEKEEFTKKFNTDKLLDAIKRVNEITETEIKLNNQRNKGNKKFEGDIHPLALLLGLSTRLHFKSFFFLNNHNDDTIIKKGSTVKETLKTTKGRKRFQFLSQNEMWRLYRGTQSKRLKAKERSELKLCLDILITANIFNSYKTGNPRTKKATPQEFYVMNPTLIYVSPNMKCDTEWQEQLMLWFNFGEEEILEMEDDYDFLEEKVEKEEK